MMLKLYRVFYFSLEFGIFRISWIIQHFFDLIKIPQDTFDNYYYVFFCNVIFFCTARLTSLTDLGLDVLFCSFFYLLFVGLFFGGIYFYLDFDLIHFN